MIKFENLCAGYGKHQILDNIDLEIKNQTITTIIGPNGCGKTTLLKSLIGMCDILSGNVFIDNKNINTITNDNNKTNNFFIIMSSLKLIPCFVSCSCVLCKSAGLGISHHCLVLIKLSLLLRS